MSITKEQLLSPMDYKVWKNKETDRREPMWKRRFDIKINKFKFKIMIKGLKSIRSSQD